MATLINLILIVSLAYFVIGFVAGLWLVCFGLVRIDPAVSASPRHVRLVLMPGLVALWPVLLFKWARVRKGGGA
ncbi:MAG: hypothetical protein ACIAXF_08230 [Phycisphaerales bacterium JB063]